LRFALFTKLDPEENNEHIFSVFNSLKKNNIDFDIDSESYKLISKKFDDISNFNFNVLLPFGIGMLAALVLMPKLINKIYEKYGKSILIFFGGLILAAGINGLLSVVT